MTTPKTLNRTLRASTAAVGLFLSCTTAHAWPCTSSMDAETCARWNEYERKQDQLRWETNQQIWQTQILDAINRSNNNNNIYNYNPYQYR